MKNGEYENEREFYTPHQSYSIDLDPPPPHPPFSDLKWGGGGSKFMVLKDYGRIMAGFHNHIQNPMIFLQNPRILAKIHQIG